MSHALETMKSYSSFNLDDGFYWENDACLSDEDDASLKPIQDEHEIKELASQRAGSHPRSFIQQNQETMRVEPLLAALEKRFMISLE